VSHAGTRAADPLAGRPTVAGVRLADASAVVGAVVWALLALAVGLGPIERALALAPLVLVPLGLTTAGAARFDGMAGRLGRLAVLGQFPCALALGASLALEGVLAAVLALPWVALTATAAAAGALRLRERGIDPPAETAIDAGLLYVPVAAGALVGSHLGVTLWFDPVIVLLTAVHFHYAGFVLPVVTGLVGRALGGGGRPFRAVTAVVVAGPALIAVGISFSPLIEVVAVGGFTLAVTALGALVVRRVVPGRRSLQAVPLALSALALPVSMALALAYGVGAFTGSTLAGVSLSRMVLVHGSLNAFGFALLGLLGWRLGPPLPLR
jgi:hypothetical protein